MATLKSYDSLKSYLDSLDVDTSNMDNDTLDLQYLDRLKKRNGEALSHDEKLQGNITLQQYLADSQAGINKDLGMAKAENTARQQTAYNDYVNSKLAKYLHIAEENNGTAGYTGITQGNRIQLANQEKNMANEIQNTKQSEIQAYLQQYNDALMGNAKTALAESTQLQGQLDTKRANENNTNMLYAQNGINGIIDKYNPVTENGMQYYDSNILDEIKNYVNSANIDDETKARLIRDAESSYNWKDYKSENIAKLNSSIENLLKRYNPTEEDGKQYYSNETLSAIDSLINASSLDEQTKKQLKDEIRTKYNFKDLKPQLKESGSKQLKWETAVGNKDLDTAHNVASRSFNFTDGDTKYTIRSSDSTGSQLQPYSKYANKVNKMQSGEFYKFTNDDGTKVILYRRNNPSASYDQDTTQFVIFKKNDVWNTKTTGFDTLWNKAVDLETL